MRFQQQMQSQRSLSLILGLAWVLTACGGSPPEATSSASPGLRGQVQVDGSSTVFPISEAMADEFQRLNPGMQVSVGKSGTGGGFEKFCAGTTDISNASRPIKAEEIALCQQNQIDFIELPIAFDGLSVVIHPDNTWANCLTLAELKRMWEPAAQGKLNNWQQIRASFPDAPLRLLGPGTASGTYDYFTKAIVGKEGESRGDYTASEDDNTLVQGVAGDQNALGYFGYAYYQENQDKLKLAAIDNGKGCVAPSPTAIADGSYQPLSRPEFIYVKTSAAARPEVKAFVEFQLAPANRALIAEIGYVPLPDPLLSAVQARFAQGKAGSVFGGQGVATDVKLIDLIKAEQ